MAEEHANRLLPDSSRMNSYFENHKNSGARPGNPVGHRMFCADKTALFAYVEELLLRR
jgi:hypothetical protein